IGMGVDGAVFNPATMEAFSSQRDGTLTVLKENSPTSFVVEQTVKTMPSAKTLTLDSKTNHILLIGAEFGAPPPPAPGGRGGRGRFDRIAAGQYELRAQFEGFKEASIRVRVGTRSPGTQKLVLSLTNLTQEVTVSNRGTEVDANSSNNLDAVAVDQSTLEN